jgi:hypothetical protein
MRSNVKITFVCDRFEGGWIFMRNRQSHNFFKNQVFGRFSKFRRVKHVSDSSGTNYTIKKKSARKR